MKWVRVSDALPPASVAVLLATNTNEIELGWLDDEGVTHWMPLPDLPRKRVEIN